MTTPEDRKAHREAVYAQQTDASTEFVQVTEPAPETAPSTPPARKIDTSENRFHALKFALQTPVGNHHDALAAAEAYLRFLDGVPEPAPAPEQPAEDVELADLTESYPADEPFVPPLGSGPEGGEMADVFAPEPEPVAFGRTAYADIPNPAPHVTSAMLNGEGGWLDNPSRPEPPVAVVDSWAAAEHAISDEALVEELFEEGAHDDADPVISPDFLALEPEQQAAILEAVLPAETPFAYEPAPQQNEWQTLPEPEADPTFEHITAAIQEIASPPPPAPDATDEAELTDEQVERAEERLATPDHIGAAEERELEPTADLYVNRQTRKIFPWIG
jgi:hypothetical protein